MENPFAKFDDSPDHDVPTATLQIYKFINEYLTRGPDTHVNRASSASMCYKRRWYQRNSYEATPLTPRKMVNFLLGDLSEKTMQYFIKAGCVGVTKLYSEVSFGNVIGQFTIQNKQIEVYEQEHLSADVGGIRVTAHVDGFGKRNSDSKWELIECKSAADFGFEAFKESGPGDYLKQAMVNMRTDKALNLGVESVRFFYLKKNTGHLFDKLYPFDHELFSEVIQEYKLSNEEAEPPRPYVPKPETFRGKSTGREVLPFPCNGYCPYTNICWNSIELEWKNSRPLYVVRQHATET